MKRQRIGRMREEKKQTDQSGEQAYGGFVKESEVDIEARTGEV